jgi:prepilin-type N-terminal cleavage/methylation domain-containing protein
MKRAGFTLVEVMVAMVVAALAISTAAAVFTATTDGVGDLVSHSEGWMRESNGRRWLAQTIGGMEVANEASGGFDGTARRLSFRSRSWVRFGWIEWGRAMIVYGDGRLSASIAGEDAIVIADSLVDASFDYLLEYGWDSPWATEWRSERNAPLAVRLRLRRPDDSADTLLFYVGERR